MSEDVIIADQTQILILTDAETAETPGAAEEHLLFGVKSDSLG